MIILVLSGSIGFTFIKHSCYACGLDDVLTTVAEANICCGHAPVSPSHHHSTDELVFSDDCCSHQAERLVTDQVIRTEVQSEIMPFFLVSNLITVIPDYNYATACMYSYNIHQHSSRDLTTFYCQMQS